MFGTVAIMVVSLTAYMVVYNPAASSTSTLKPIVTVTIPNGAGSSLGYSPGSIVVVIGVNNTVVWQNDDSSPHTVTPQSQPIGAGMPKGTLCHGGAFAYTFTVPGEYGYQDIFHAGMQGSVDVLAGSSSTSS